MLCKRSEIGGPGAEPTTCLQRKEFLKLLRIHMRHPVATMVDDLLAELTFCGSPAGLTAADLHVLVDRGWSIAKLATLCGCRELVLDRAVSSAMATSESFKSNVALVVQCDNGAANIPGRCWKGVSRSA